ncbi:MAG: MFS transporter [Pseudomonadota bacterium]
MAQTETVQLKERTPLAIWAGFLVICFFFFHITSSTFTSLGVVLPSMIEEQGWSWSEAGLGFSILALVVGLAALIPAWIIRRGSVKLSFCIGGLIMMAGFSLLATTQSLIQYFIGTGLAGFGFTLCGNVPAVHYVNTKFSEDKRSGAIGWYLTIGGMGGVAGPLLVTLIMGETGNWRDFWWYATGCSALMIALTAAALTGKAGASPLDRGAQEGDGEVQDSGPQWTYGQVIRTRQYHIIVAALTLTLFCGLTLNSWAVTHMTALDVAPAIAAGALSGHALINALSRGFGALAVKVVAAKWLLVSALAAEVVGMLALSQASTPLMITLFGLGEGYGYGMCLFATTVLLVDYFGTARNPELLGSMHLVTTIAMIGPTLAGFVAERIGGFGPVFMGYAGIVFVVMLAAIFMRAPRLPSQGEEPAMAERADGRQLA